MKRVEHFNPEASKSVSSFIEQMLNVGVLGAGRLARAARIFKQMITDDKCFTFLSMSGPMVPGGLRIAVSQLVEKGLIDAIVTSGANIVHDLLEAYGGAHYRVPSGINDEQLRSEGMGRVADIFIYEQDFETFEEKIYAFLDSLPSESMSGMSPSEFLHTIGMTLTDKSSILYQAARKNVPIFSPGLMDSMLGFHLFTYSTAKSFSLDFVKDLRVLAELINSAEKTGAMMLGGGLTKHFTMGSTILKGGLDYAVQITLDRPEGGSLSGAPLKEGVSWQKIQVEANYETVIGDATILFPLIVAYSMN